jgi:predicted phosphate transport protein (TIGR00153 family)
MLLPDTRADVLSLIKSLDNIIDLTEEITKEFNIQKPSFPSSLNLDLSELTSNSLKSADALLSAVRSFFSQVHLVTAHINHVNFYEHEADLLEYKINDEIFNGEIVTELAHKLQLKDFVSKISSISDEAELIGEKLAIFTIKREI